MSRYPEGQQQDKGLEEEWGDIKKDWVGVGESGWDRSQDRSSLSSMLRNSKARNVLNQRVNMIQSVLNHALL